mgnify:CR=1 FL=1
MANAFLGQPLTDPLDSGVLPFAFHIVLAAHSWVATDLTADMHIFVFPLRSPVEDYTFSLAANCGIYTSNQPVNLLNQDANECTDRYSGGFTTLSVPAACIPTPQPKYIGFRVSAAYFLEHADESDFRNTELIPKNCFILTRTAEPVTTLSPVHDVEIGTIPLSTVFMYGVTLTRDSTAALHLARLDVSAVLTDVIDAPTISIVVFLSANSETCPVSPKSSFVDNAFYASTTGCTLASVTATTLTVTCIDGPFDPSQPFVFGFSHLQLDPAESATFDNPAQFASSCFTVKIAFGSTSTAGAPLHTVSAPPPLQVSVDRTQGLDLHPDAKLHLQVSFFDWFFSPAVTAIELVLHTNGDYAYDFTDNYDPGVAGVTHIEPTSSYVATIILEPAYQVGPVADPCTRNAPCTYRLPVARSFAAGPSNPLQLLTINTLGRDLSRDFDTQVPITVLPNALQPQQTPAPPLSINSALITVSGINERMMTIVFLLTQTTKSYFAMNIVITLPLTGLSYDFAAYSVIVGTGSASVLASVDAAGIITLPYISAMVNTSVFLLIEQVTVTAPTDQTAVIVELVGSRTTSAVMTDYMHKLMNIGFCADSTAVSASFAYASKDINLSDAPDRVVAGSCTHSVGTARYTVTCDVAWSLVNDVTASLELALVTRDVPPHVTPTDVKLDSVSRLQPAPVSSLCTPVADGANIALNTCIDAGTSAFTIRVTISCVQLIGEQEIELRLLSHTTLRAIAVIPVLAAGPYSIAVTSVTHSLETGKNYGIMRAVINVPYWTQSVSAAQTLQIMLQGSPATVRFVTSTTLTMAVQASLTDKFSNSCDLICAATEGTPPDAVRAIECSLTNCSALTGPELTLWIENTDFGTVTEERSEIAVSILNSKNQQLYSGLFDVVRGSVQSYTNNATTTGLTHTLTASATLCAGGNVIVNPDEYFVLTLPLSMRTAAVLTVLSSADFKLTVPLIAGGTSVQTLAVAPLSPFSSMKLSLIDLPQYFCLGNASAVLTISLALPVSHTAGEAYLLELVSTGGLTRFMFEAILPASVSMTPAYSISEATITHGLSGLTSSAITTNLFALPPGMLSEATVEITLGPQCSFFPSVTALSVDKSAYNTQLAAYTQQRPEEWGVPTSTLSLRFANISLPSLTIAGIMCISNTTYSVTQNVYFSHPLPAYIVTTSLVALDSGMGTVAAALLQTMYVFPDWNTVGASFLAPQIGNFPGPPAATLLDMGIIVTPAIPIPPNYYLVMTVSWANLADSAELALALPDTLIPDSSTDIGTSGIVTATGAMWIQFDKGGWPAGRSFVMLRRNVSVDTTKLINPPTATITVCYNRTVAATTAIAKSTVDMALRTDFTVPMPVAFSLSPVRHGGAYGRAFTMEITFTTTTPVFLPKTGTVFAELSVIFPNMTVLTGVKH